MMGIVRLPRASVIYHLFYPGLLMMGVIRLPRINDYWSHAFSLDFFRNRLGIASTRLKALSKCLKFSDPEADDKNIKGEEGYDPIIEIRLLVSHMKEKCRTLFHPDRYFSIDERMLRFKGRHSMRQYIPCKPDPYGFKLWALADSSTGYLVDFNVYFGASGDKPEVGLATKVVLDLIDPGPGLKLGAGYQLCVDNYYTSKALLEKLLEKKTLACGTLKLRRNRKGFPKQLAGTVEKSYRGDFRWVRDGNLTFYEWHDNSQVLFRLLCAHMHV